MTTMTSELEHLLKHLRELVSHDTRNPPRNIDGDCGIFAYIRDALPDFRHEVLDLGEGCVCLLSVRGEQPRVLFNCLLDTVPAAAGWSADPLVLRIEQGRAVGLGACDIKGAAAAMMVAVEAVPDAPIALLFSTDEEAGSSRCIREFLKGSMGAVGYEVALVAEPTMGRAVLQHRGIVTMTGEFTGVAGHASQRRALADSAVHEAVRWVSAALKYAQDEEHGDIMDNEVLPGVRFNLGRIEGGTKPNMIADRAQLRWGVRPGPAYFAQRVAKGLCELAGDASRVVWTPGFDGPGLPALREGDTSAGRLKSAAAAAKMLGLEVAAAVDFWTEAALFSEAGMDAIVCGPGDIAQAHTPDEWVTLEQLDTTRAAYEAALRRLLQR
jgi:acetylornithine deacetylase